MPTAPGVLLQPHSRILPRLMQKSATSRYSTFLSQERSCYFFGRMRDGSYGRSERRAEALAREHRSWQLPPTHRGTEC